MNRRVDEPAPDFDRLRRERDAALEKAMYAICAEFGWRPEEVQAHFIGNNGCYCACPEGPCEHRFEGWRDFEDDNGGERVCSLCGMGAMSHDLRCGP